MLPSSQTQGAAMLPEREMRGLGMTSGLYVHIPFCSIKCFYCDFTAFSGQRKSIARYLKALHAETAFYAGYKPKTLYIGGGTPSELSALELENLFQLLQDSFGSMRAMQESTLEANPESMGLEKIELLQRFGVSRLSLGLQTAEPQLLKAIGRQHNVEDFLRVFYWAKERMLDVNVDLMLGLPGQTLDQALQSRDFVLDLVPDHISLYSLQVEDRTLFARRRVEVDEDLTCDMMQACLQELRLAGYQHYEVSNFALPGKECLHNLNYWHNGPYIGLGCGAAGYLKGVRYQNEDRLGLYCDKVEKGQRPQVFSESLFGKEKLGETIMLGLRKLEGMPLSPEMQSLFRPEIEKLLGEGLLELSPAGCSKRLPKMRLSSRGLFLANRVFREFV